MDKKKIMEINRFILAGTLLSTVLLCAFGYFMENNPVVILQGMLLYGSFLFWFILYSSALQRELGKFMQEICETMDKMQKGMEISDIVWSEDSMFAHIGHRLMRLYDIMQRNKEEIRKEKKELQSLITDISHQLKTPMTNLKIMNETLLNHKLLPEQQKEFLHNTGRQLEKLDFLMDSMIKTSRLETGIIELRKETAGILETLAGALGQVYRKAKEKKIQITVECPEELQISHDRKWTEEVFFNLLDNAVKYTPEYGRIQISVLKQEMYTRINITDNGIGIEEKSQGAVFQRFYREKEVHNIEGIGIGLYLARKIVTMQGGYILLRSKRGEGSCFSVYLLNQFTITEDNAV